MQIRVAALVLLSLTQLGLTSAARQGDTHTLDGQAGELPPIAWTAGFSSIEQPGLQAIPAREVPEWRGNSLVAGDEQGRLEFSVQGGKGAVAIRDIWNDVDLAQVSLGSEAAGLQMLNKLFSCAVLVSAEQRVDLINTASLAVAYSLKTGADPVAILATRDERFLFVAERGGKLVAVFDLRAQPDPTLIARLPLKSAPRAMAISTDETQLRLFSDDDKLEYIAIPPASIEEHVIWSAEDGTEVVVLGMIHSGHRTSTTWGLDQLRETIRRIEPDVVCTEIPPERWRRAWGEFAQEGVVHEPRVQRFPEYVDCLFALKLQMGFEIEPCAGWTKEMNDLRNRRIADFRSEFPKDQAQMEAEEAAIGERQATDPLDEDDPRQIHSDRYDARTKESLGPYDLYLNEWIGPGGWTNINAAHYALIEAAIARHRGKRILVTFGAGHKYWILEQLRARKDLTVLDPAPFLPN